MSNASRTFSTCLFVCFLSRRPMPSTAADLKRKGTPIGPHDVLIAAQARRHDATLVTANTREFSRVPGLRLEDWTAA